MGLPIGLASFYVLYIILLLGYFQTIETNFEIKIAIRFDQYANTETCDIDQIKLEMYIIFEFV